MAVWLRHRDTSARAAARALVPFLAEYRQETGIDLADQVRTDRKLTRLALAHAELSTLIDDTTGLAAKPQETDTDATSAMRGKRLSLRINDLLYVTADEIRHRLVRLAASRPDTGESR